MLRHLRSQSGVTLVELMTVFVLVGIALAIAIPNFRSNMERANLDRVPVELESDLRLAISTAKARGRPMQIVFGESGYNVRDAADTTQVLRSRDFGTHASFNASGDPMIFPWGLVQPTDVTVTTPQGATRSVSFLPTGKLVHNN